MRKQRITEAVWGYLFVLPTVALLIVFVVVPALNAGYLSLTRYDFLSPPRFIGLTNYLDALQDPVFYQVMGNTLVFSIGVPIGILLALFLAVLLVDKKLRGATVYRAIYFLPVVLPLIAIGTVWLWLFNPEYGPINQALRAVGLRPVPWLTSYEWSKVAVIIVGVWSGFGGSLVILLGGLASISETYYEAARIDGASPRQSFRFITLPLLVPTITVVSIASFIGAFQVFDLVLVLTGGGPGRSSTPIVQYLYEQGFRSFNMGYATALSVLLFLVIFVLSIFQFRLSEYLRNH